MKTYIPFVVVAVLGWTSLCLAAPENVNGWRQARWGMSEEQVLKAFKGEATRVEHPDGKGQEKGSLEIPNFVLDSKEFKATFWFTEGKLTSVFIKRSEGEIVGKAMFHSLEDMLISKYGPPSVKRPDSVQGIATWKTSWFLKGTSINLNYLGSGDKGMVFLDYSKPKKDLSQL